VPLRPLALQAPAAALVAALDAASAGQMEVAQRALHTAGAPERLIAQFLDQLGAAPVQYVLLALQALDSPAPVVTSSLLLVGRAAAWWIDEPPTAAAPVLLQSVDAAAVQTRLRALLQRLERAGGRRADLDGDANE
ncbi:MAG: hypothetical protein RMM29_10370, partial [Planctomycetota bacterium]|nr:hypothetical protein [Planctomycetota bacterium]